MTPEQLTRAAEILDQIQALGTELLKIAQSDDPHPITTPIGDMQQYAGENLAVDAEVFLTPAQLAEQLRALVRGKNIPRRRKI